MKRTTIFTISTVILMSFIGCGDTDSKVSETKVTHDSKSEKKVEKQISKESKNISDNEETPFIKKYGVKSGKVEYEIKGSGNIMGMNIKKTGKKRLVFSDYGSYELVEEDTIEKRERQDGKVTEIKQHKLIYNSEAVIYRVNFKNKKIMRIKNPGIAMFLGMVGDDINKNIEKTMKSFGGKKIGKDKVLGYECDIWSLMGTKQCIYKGVVLKSETDIMGIKNTEIATKADFESDIDKSDFKLPDFPIFSERGETIEKSKLEAMDKKVKEKALKKKESMRELSQSMQKAQKEIEKNPKMSNEEKAEALIKSMFSSKSMDSKFAKQKASMPKILNMMKSYRKCIASSNSQSDMDGCVKDVEKISHDLGLDEFDDEHHDKPVWSKANREKTLKEIDNGIKELEKTLPCMQKSKNMMEFIQCARDVH